MWFPSLGYVIQGRFYDFGANIRIQSPPSRQVLLSVRRGKDRGIFRHRVPHTFAPNSHHLHNTKINRQEEQWIRFSWFYGNCTFPVLKKQTFNINNYHSSSMFRLYVKKIFFHMFEIDESWEIIISQKPINQFMKTS